MSSRRISSLFQQQKNQATPGVHKGGVSKKDATSSKQAAVTKRKAAERDEEQMEARDLVLKKFDLCMKYGPCIGMTRLERWERAEELGLSPPANVRHVLTELATSSNKAPGELEENKCLWEDRI
mmetsp:Transcript_10963/g.28124  ORF Transcript_10963/g.28124 Transcript_10963/m.28124 type:complete len:124 (-) Transcript_10963:145-516(-)